MNTGPEVQLGLSLIQGFMITSELRDELEKKKKELKEAEQKLKTEGAVSAKSKMTLGLHPRLV